MKVINLSEQNSILHHYLKEMRSVDIQKDPLRFRKNLERMGEITAYEISKTLNFKKEETQTPLGISPTLQLDEKIVLGTILRAGVPFHQGFLNYFDRAESAFVSAYRKHKDALKFDIHIEYIAAPKLDEKTLILVDPMLATGGSMELAYGALMTKGKPQKSILATIIASQQAVDYLQEIFDDSVTIWVGAIDDKLNERSYIVPGLGDVGDLAYGDKL